MTHALMLCDSDEDIARAAHTLARGELLGLPTETVYGLAADALQAEAVAAVFKAKGRPANHPLIVHLASVSHVGEFAQNLPACAQALMEAFWPGPLTLILQRRADVAEAAAGGHPTIALRCPSHPLAQKVLQHAWGLGVKGVAAPSANVFGKVSPTTAQHVREAFPELAVLDGGACQVGIESTIVDISQGTPVLLRPGMLPVAQLSQVAGQPVQRAQPEPSASTPAAPGTLASHYAPRARVRLYTAPQIEAFAATCPGRLAAWSRTPLSLPSSVLWRAMPAQPADCAHDLFAQLRSLDALGVDHIWVETPPDTEAWDGVRDRLQRASNDSTTGE
ncbi:MAG: L-threonylcarbamoyladenylate synthase [Limnohabitans sp.]